MHINTVIILSWSSLWEVQGKGINFVRSYPICSENRVGSSVSGALIFYMSIKLLAFRTENMQKDFTVF